jgi:hypothetical protein
VMHANLKRSRLEVTKEGTDCRSVAVTITGLVFIDSCKWVGSPLRADLSRLRAIYFPRLSK